MQIDVANGTGTSGLANHVVEKLAARGFTGGNKQTVSVRSTTTVSYGKGAEPAATALASELGLTATASTATSKNTVRLTVGTDSNNSPLLAGFTPPADGDSSTSTTTPAPPKPIDATATGGKAPTPTDLSRLDSAGVPCVK